MSHFFFQIFMVAPISKSPHFFLYKNLISYGKWQPCIPSGSPHIFKISLCMNYTFQIPFVAVYSFSPFPTQLPKKFPFPYVFSNLSCSLNGSKNPFSFKISMWRESYLHGLKESSLIKSPKKRSFHI